LIIVFDYRIIILPLSRPFRLPLIRG